MDQHIQTPWWRTRGGMVLVGFLTVGAFFLITEHTAHVLGALPFLLLALCPLMLLFMHHGHGGQHHDSGEGQMRDDAAKPTGGSDERR